MVFYNFCCDKCSKQFECEFENYDEYKLKESKEEILCECGEKLRREFVINLSIPSYMQATSDDNGTYEYAKHRMKTAKRPSGRDSKLFY